MALATLPRGRYNEDVGGNNRPQGETILERVREKIETALDCEFGEGRFEELGPASQDDSTP